MLVKANCFIEHRECSLNLTSHAAWEVKENTCIKRSEVTVSGWLYDRDAPINHFCGFKKTKTFAFVEWKVCSTICGNPFYIFFLKMQSPAVIIEIFKKFVNDDKREDDKKVQSITSLVVFFCIISHFGKQGKKIKREVKR